jgi:hypothetical protein
MKYVHIPVIALALSALTLAGCAAVTQHDETKSERVCVRKDQIYSFNGLDDSHVYVSVRASEHYLFTTDKGCPGLRFARSIVIADQSARVCDDGFYFLSFDSPGAGERRCRILKIEKVADEEEARSLIDSRRPMK